MSNAARARLAPVDPASAPGQAKEIFQGPLAGKHFNIFKSMATSPAVLQAYLGMSGALAGGLLSAKEREAVQLAVGEANRCDYCLAAHTAIGKGAGMTEQQTIDARKGIMPGDAKLAALVKFALTLHERRGNVTDADLAAIRAAGYGDGHIGEVVANYGLAIFTNFFNHVNQTPVDFPPAPKL